ncbi:GreA/GreB family elongation factor [Bifidobacterium scardovii]|uniref:Transcription elongation factor GreA n=1 Tax=Bifidobacterium scardovii TaxID=158787 RepID=A0A087DHX0_9BIFI|nr:transcription elongation factor GreA [Bifidobacterium scardovii]KFI95120.1 transcription elongation factor GreA [Bifidobacterium scardovii]MDK6348801.1 transcription elongation factor GreA [Bifidobacterium scardovii]MDU2421746.1 transcription elongation factor GreA [Bifidobacterium scardovii]MDU8981155.1 transcription elongation factor GreA [Bifidobacterium scardovii]BAQ31507.1 transcription elongation factor GreA [Bifidobacterium scardovii JCM 12489 = DSM 13734]
MGNEEKAVLLTQDAYDKLKADLAYREGQYREEITKRIAAARAEGDLSENGGYQAAREEQGKNEGRINELIVKLRNAKIVQAPEEGTVGNGSLVTIELGGNEMRYVLGARDMASVSEYDVLSEDSPIGKAIIGAKTGDTVSYQAPNGRTISVTIKDAKPLQ